MEHIKEIITNKKNTSAPQNLNVEPDKKIWNNANNQQQVALDIREILRRNLNVSTLDNTFDNFKKKEGTEKSLELFKLYAEGMLGTPFLVCIGDYGCGKTHLMEALVIKRHELGNFTRIIKFNKFIENLKTSIISGSFPSYDQILEAHCNAGTLVMDDIGMGSKETSWLTSVLETLIDTRYYQRLETVLSMNKEAWASLPQRVVSRLCDGEVCTIVENNGKDYRKTK